MARILHQTVGAVPRSVRTGRRCQPDAVASGAGDPRASVKIFLYFARTYTWHTTVMVLCLVLGGFAEGLGLSSALPLLGHRRRDERGGATAGRALRARGARARGAPPRDRDVALRDRAGLHAQGGPGAAGQQAGRIHGRACRHGPASRAAAGARSRTRWSYYTRLPVGTVSNAIATEAGPRLAVLSVPGADAARSWWPTLVYTGFALTVSWQATLVAAFGRRPQPAPPERAGADGAPGGGSPDQGAEADARAPDRRAADREAAQGHRARGRRSGRCSRTTPSASTARCASASSARRR